jgi:hypothetical protein
VDIVYRPARIVDSIEATNVASRRVCTGPIDRVEPTGQVPAG